MGAVEVRSQLMEIKKTKTYKKMSPVLKKITLSRTQVKQIFRGLEKAREVGYKKWDRISIAKQRNKDIVKELLENES